MMFRYTKIGVTLGPACNDRPMIKALAEKGVDFFRLNFSHGTHETHGAMIKMIRRVEREIRRPLAIMQDLQGPKMRLGVLPTEGVRLKTGDSVVFNTRLTDYQSTVGELPITYPNLEKFLKPRQHVLIDDGHLEFVIEKIKGSKIIGRLLQGGVAQSHKGFNFPNSKLTSIPALSEKDKEDVNFGVEQGVDFISLSFVKNARDIVSLRSWIQSCQKKSGLNSMTPIHVVAKIERAEAVEHLDEIVASADGIMVARGDLGLEMPAAELPLTQKRIIAVANNAAKPVIVATQLLDSMQHSPRPTRAEVSDVANAVIDHTDALMVSNETAVGEFPLAVVETLDAIIRTTEKSTYDDSAFPVVHRIGTTVPTAITKFSRLIAEELNVKMIISASLTGTTARLLSTVRPNIPIIIATTAERLTRQLGLLWGVESFVLPKCATPDQLINKSLDHLKKLKRLMTGDKVVIVGGHQVGQSGMISLIEVRTI